MTSDSGLAATCYVGAFATAAVPAVDVPHCNLICCILRFVLLQSAQLIIHLL